VTRYDPIRVSIWEIDMGYQYGISDINEISIWEIDVEYGISIWDMGYLHGSHIDMVILDIDMGYGLMIWEMTVSIWSSWISIWDILSLWQVGRQLSWESEGVIAELELL